MGLIAVLTAPAGRGLSDREIETVRCLFGGGVGDAVRLAPHAAEFPFEGALPDGLAQAVDGIDVNAVPAAGRRKRVLIADMDSTMIPVECIDELADFAGVKPQVADITERAMSGELDFEGALRARVRLIAGLGEEVLERVFTERVSLNPGAAVLVRTMRASGAKTLLVSGGFTYFTERVAEAAGFACHRANGLIFEGGRLTGEVAEPIVGPEAKLAALKAAVAEVGCGLDGALAVGDGANDLAMVEAAGLGVGFRPKPALTARADAVIRHSDLDALLFLQGYQADEIVRG